VIIGGPATRIVGLVALTAACGCGSGPGAPTPLPAIPPAVQTSADSSDPATAVDVTPPPVPGYRHSFDSPLRAPAVATGDPELDPLVAYLKASFAAAIKNGHRLVILDRTDVDLLFMQRSYQDLVDGLLKRASDRVPAEMIRDFGEKNPESSAVWPELPRHLPATLLTLRERDAFFPGELDEGWRRFYEKYPGSGGIITVSRVGLNRDKTLAFFYLGFVCGTLCGHGQLHVLKKEGDAWVELPVSIGPHWVS
jgi:hypothetical protein